jgi:hypothetical protein
LVINDVVIDYGMVISLIVYSHLVSPLMIPKSAALEKCAWESGIMDCVESIQEYEPAHLELVASLAL